MAKMTLNVKVIDPNFECQPYAWKCLSFVSSHHTLCYKDYLQSSFSLVFNSGTNDLASRLGTNGLVKQYNLLH